MIVHLNDWPGMGKFTVGRLVANCLGARFVHIHILHDVAIACAGYDDPERGPLYEEVRRAAYEVLLRRPAREVFVLTNALCTNSPANERPGTTSSTSPSRAARAGGARGVAGRERTPSGEPRAPGAQAGARPGCGA